MHISIALIAAALVVGLALLTGRFLRRAPLLSEVPITYAAHHIRRYIVGGTTQRPCCTPEHFATAERLIAQFHAMHCGNPCCETWLLCLRQDLRMVREAVALRAQQEAIQRLAAETSLPLSLPNLCPQ